MSASAREPALWIGDEFVRDQNDPQHFGLGIPASATDAGAHRSTIEISNRR